MFVLVIILMLPYNEKVWHKNKHVQVEEKNSTRKLNVGVKACAERGKMIKERPDQRGNKLWIPSGQDPTQINFQLVKRPKYSLLLKRNNKQRLL